MADAAQIRKPLVFLGDSLAELRAFPQEAKNETGYQLDLVELGEDPLD